MANERLVLCGYAGVTAELQTILHGRVQVGMSTAVAFSAVNGFVADAFRPLTQKIGASRGLQGQHVSPRHQGLHGAGRRLSQGAIQRSGAVSCVAS
jgi:hypothetical protein